MSALEEDLSDMEEEDEEEEEEEEEDEEVCTYVVLPPCILIFKLVVHLRMLAAKQLCYRTLALVQHSDGHMYLSPSIL